ncbi:glycine rich domain-containing protein, partial [Paenimyroides viscosum]|uniref:glycine rich domain-containing protein n=1 Tax=Paenimyroides viscosum TaxID=2488729 RepID=UPI001F15E5E6
MKNITQQSRFKIRWLTTNVFVLFLIGLFLTFFQGHAQTFNYTGAVQTVTLPAGSYEIEAWGGDGGNNLAANTGGKGGYAKGILNVTTSTTYYIYVGGKGLTQQVASTSVIGGFNGGGTSGAYSSVSLPASSGGGASHVATTTGLLSTLSTNQSAVIIVAGGAGGAGSNNGGSNTMNNGGHGGGLTGGNGAAGGYGGTGGSQTAGGTGTMGNGSFGQGGNNSGNNTGAGGGGGWYGGGAAQWEGSGGGSSYIGGIAAATTIMFGQAGFVPNPDTTGNGTISITSMAPCTGSPTAGTASVTPTSRTCASQPFTLSVAGAIKAGGISYMWERSDAGTGVWVATGATSSTYTVTNQTVSSDYRFVVTCTPSNSVSYSNVVTMLQPTAAGVFYESFDTTAQGTSSNASPPTCWTYLDSHTGYGYTYSTAGRTGNGFYVYMPVATGDLKLISPTTDNLGNGTKQVRFWAKVSSTTYIPT